MHRWGFVDVGREVFGAFANGRAENTCRVGCGIEAIGIQIIRAEICVILDIVVDPVGLDRHAVDCCDGLSALYMHEFRRAVFKVDYKRVVAIGEVNGACVRVGGQSVARHRERQDVNALAAINARAKAKADVVVASARLDVDLKAGVVAHINLVALVGAKDCGCHAKIDVVKGRC